jgi:hypothetical protein
MAGRQVKILALAFGLATAVSAQAGDALRLTDAEFHEIESMERAAEGRPNEEARLSALKAYRRGDYGDALGHFHRGAYYADKFSQHSLSLMHWHGVGVPVDRVQAYVWADLAAERGARSLLLLRERMWQELSADERERARSMGPQHYARYGDEVARPRAEAIMRRFAAKMTGSRAGFDAQKLEIAGRPQGGTFAPQVGSMSTMYIDSVAASHEELYGGVRRDLVAYWAGQDRLLDGRVEVGPMRSVRGRAR